jgi:uncharacterized protein YprB with RNaseH-like and TPR domain
MSTTDLRQRLERLRAHRPRARAEAPSPAPRPHDDALPGERVETPRGAFHLIETRYPLSQRHGPRALAEAFAHPPQTAARLARDEALGGTDPRGLAFIDTETTGLMGGAGTLVFLIGVGVCEAEAFVVRQYFLSEPAHEPALFTALVADLAPRAGWVTFNGKAFDLPLIETRLTVNRQRGALGQRPHLDLLAPARRLYRGRLPSCALGDIERGVFKIAREDDDVPGWLIPQLYNEYLRTGDPRQMRRVIYHNTVDILSMVTLAAHLMEMFEAAPETGRRPTPQGSGPATDDRRPAKRGRQTAEDGRAQAPAAADWLRLGGWHADQGREAEAEAAYRQALAGRLELDDRALGLRQLAALLKRLGRRAEAAPLWEQWASFSVDDPAPFVELAKYHEWHSGELRQAEAWTRQALKVAGAQPAGWRRAEAVRELEQRLGRVQTKLAR